MNAKGKDAGQSSAEPPPEDLTEKIVAHLSKEIETTSNNMMVFRTRIGFGLLVGPFLLLGSLVVGAKGQPISFNLRWYEWLPALVVILFCYLGIAYIASQIEAQAWEQCNRWRNLMGRLYKNPSAKMAEKDMESNQHRSKAGYMVGYSFLFFAVLAAVFIVKNAGTR